MCGCASPLEAEADAEAEKDDDDDEEEEEEGEEGRQEGAAEGHITKGAVNDSTAAAHVDPRLAAEPHCIVFSGELAPALLHLMRLGGGSCRGRGRGRRRQRRPWTSVGTLVGRVVGGRFNESVGEMVLNMLVTLWIEGVVETRRLKPRAAQ